MGLRASVDGWLGRLGSTRLHVLVVEPPGSWAVRATVERECALRGWVVALTPADADALVVCGPASGAVGDAVEQLWSSMPGPRVRAEVTAAAAVPGVLNELAERYRAWGRAADPGSSSPAEESGRFDEQDEPGEEPSGTGTGEKDPDDGDPDEGDPDGMDMDMSGPGGIALASGADDRDGLEMDVLHLPLGPVLAGWPPELTLLVTLQGDVIVEVEVQRLEPTVEADSEAYRLDAAAQLLRLTGAGVLADRVGLARDVRLGLLASEPDLAGLRRRVERSPAVRRALRRVGPVETVEDGWPAGWAGDAYERLLRMLQPVADRSLPTVDVEVFAAALSRLLTGSELGSARLTVASLGGLAQLTASADRAQVPV